MALSTSDFKMKVGDVAQIACMGRWPIYNPGGAYNLYIDIAAGAAAIILDFDMQMSNRSIYNLVTVMVQDGKIIQIHDSYLKDLDWAR